MDELMKKVNFIKHELQALVKKIDSNILCLAPMMNVNCDDVEYVKIWYANCTIEVNVECDSLAAITKDVIKAIM